MYAGSLYGGKRDPSILFDSINQLIDEGKIRKDKIIIDFYGDDTNLAKLSRKYGIEENVKIHGKNHGNISEITEMVKNHSA